MLKSCANRRGARAVERAGLENRYTRKRIVGSNPTLSASESAAFCLRLRVSENTPNIQTLCRVLASICACERWQSGPAIALWVRDSPLGIFEVHMRSRQCCQFWSGTADISRGLATRNDEDLALFCPACRKLVEDSA
jgi:hypothetical protein